MEVSLFILPSCVGTVVFVFFLGEVVLFVSCFCFTIVSKLFASEAHGILKTVDRS